jgi:hypothetical protein
MRRKHAFQTIKEAAKTISTARDESRPGRQPTTLMTPSQTAGMVVKGIDHLVPFGMWRRNLQTSARRKPPRIEIFVGGFYKFTWKPRVSGSSGGFWIVLSTISTVCK